MRRSSPIWVHKCCISPPRRTPWLPHRTFKSLDPPKALPIGLPVSLRLVFLVLLLRINFGVNMRFLNPCRPRTRPREGEETAETASPRRRTLSFFRVRERARPVRPSAANSECSSVAHQRSGSSNLTLHRLPPLVRAACLWVQDGYCSHRESISVSACIDGSPGGACFWCDESLTKNKIDIFWRSWNLKVFRKSRYKQTSADLLDELMHSTLYNPTNVLLLFMGNCPRAALSSQMKEMNWARFASSLRKAGFEDGVQPKTKEPHPDHSAKWSVCARRQCLQ